jgi:hypothetical protein
MQTGGGETDSRGDLEQVSRPQAIELLRRKLELLPRGEECLCAAAGRYGVFCKGFAGLSDKEFRSRFDWIARTRPKASRKELEDLVSAYHKGRQEVTGTRICCDAETREHCVCDGWNAFDNEALEKLCLEIARRRVHIL